MMHIGELADRAGMSQRTIRHYDEVGLLKPSGRTEGGFRLYTEDDLARLLLIRRMKPLGYTLEQMGELLVVIDALSQSPGDGEQRAALQRMIGEAAERRERLLAHLGYADEFLAILSRA